MAAQPLRVLLIEDCAVAAALVRGYLTRCHDVEFRVVTAKCLSTGLDLLGRQPFDAVLLDLGLPDSQGLDGLTRIRRQAPALPVVILTGMEEELLGLEAVHLGAQDYLVKNQLTKPLLIRSLRYAVERCAVTEQLRLREAQLGVLTEQLPAVVWITDEQLRFVSSLGAGLFGLDLRPDQLTGQSLLDYFHAADPPPSPILAHKQALQGERVTLEMEWQERYYQARIEPFRGPDGRITGTIGVALDVTDHRQVEWEFRLAQQIQQGLLPARVPALPGLEIAGACYPARATGGDFFDYIALPDGSLLIAIGDASGHGFGPAILAAITHACLQVLSQTGVELPRILSATSRLLHEDTGGEQFVTLLLAHVEPLTRSLVWTNAGHPYGYVLDSSGQVKTRLESTGPFLGLGPENEFPLASMVQLEPGDLVLFITDGILEATCPKGRMLGVEHALQIVRDNRGHSAQDIVNTLCRGVQGGERGQPPHDDITAVVIKVLPH